MVDASFEVDQSFFKYIPFNKKIGNLTKVINNAEKEIEELSDQNNNNKDKIKESKTILSNYQEIIDNNQKIIRDKEIAYRDQEMEIEIAKGPENIEDTRENAIKQVMKSSGIKADQHDNFNKGVEIGTGKRKTQLHVKQVITPVFNEHESAALAQQAKAMFKKYYDDSSEIYKREPSIQRTAEEKLRCSQRDLMGDYINYCEHPSSTSQASLERR